jgi:DNA-binding NtrC family response regulator
MRRSVLIIEDSPSTADLARWTLLDLACEVEVADNAPLALDLLRGRFSPRLMVVDAFLQGVQPLTFFEELHAAAPAAVMVLLVDRGVAAPTWHGIGAQVAKPLQPRRFGCVVAELLAGADAAGGDETGTSLGT